jgi:hypothetical protein
MTKYFIAIIFLLMGETNFAQASPPPISGANGGAYSAFADEYDLSGKRLSDKPEISGTEMFNIQWGTGIVILKNGQQFRNVALQFSNADNTLYFKKDGLVYKFASPVKEFELDYTDNVIKKVVYFRSSYPEINKNDSNSLYQLIVDGPKVQLLKFILSKVEDQFVMNASSEKKYVQQVKYYVYDVIKNKIIAVSNSYKSINAAIPEYKAALDKVIDQNNYNLKSYKDLSELLYKLNMAD